MSRRRDDDYQKRLDLLMAMTPQLEADGWRSLETAPHDGTEVEIRIVHFLAAACDDPIQEGYIGTVRAHWVDHNGGGLPWHGLAGTPSQWRPLRKTEKSA
jgi:hypothetical protein